MRQREPWQLARDRAMEREAAEYIGLWRDQTPPEEPLRPAKSDKRSGPARQRRGSVTPLPPGGRITANGNPNKGD